MKIKNNGYIYLKIFWQGRKQQKLDTNFST